MSLSPLSSGDRHRGDVMKRLLGSAPLLPVDRGQEHQERGLWKHQRLWEQQREPGHADQAGQAPVALFIYLLLLFLLLLHLFLLLHGGADLHGDDRQDPPQHLMPPKALLHRLHGHGGGRPGYVHRYLAKQIHWDGQEDHIHEEQGRLRGQGPCDHLTQLWFVCSNSHVSSLKNSHCNKYSIITLCFPNCLKGGHCCFGVNLTE